MFQRYARDRRPGQAIDQNRAVPASRDDRRLVLFTSMFVIVAAVLVAAALLFATSREAEPGPRKPLFLGLRTPLTKKIRDGGPLYFASPFGDRGFWLDLEQGSIVAYALTEPGTSDCIVKWKARQDAYIDCHDRAVAPTMLDRYRVTIGPRGGSPAGSVYVDLRRREPAPAPSGAGG
jgi:hypothetical protein